MGSKDSHSGLANRALCRCLRPRLAMYLDRHVCLNSKIEIVKICVVFS
jgi:hypothetical protein